MVLVKNAMNEMDNFQNKVEGEGWPVVFPVCEKHKHDFYSEYAGAVVRKKERCVLCYPRNNDSLGG